MEHRRRRHTELVQDALKFLTHFLGDMHQPLHLTGRNRGRNGDKVAFDGFTTTYGARFSSRNASAGFRRIIPTPFPSQALNHTSDIPYTRRIVWEGLLGKWKDGLDDWLVCPPSPCALVRRHGQAHHPSSSAWQTVTVLSLFSSVSKDEAKPIHELNCEIVLVVPPALDFVPHAANHDGEECARGDASDGDAYDTFMALRWGSHYIPPSMRP
ncbi:hypothetical protein V8E55_007775 [Tylopilus felleus]